MQAPLGPERGSEVSSKYFNAFIVYYLSEYHSGSTQTWHSLNADKDVLAIKRSSTISAAITITVTVLAYLSLAHKACCVYNIQMNDVVNADL